MIERLHLTVLLGFAALIGGVLMIVSGIAVDWTWMRFLTPVVGIVLLFLALFDSWLWKLPILHPWFVKRPFVGGSWSVEIDSRWVDPASGRIRGKIQGFVVIRQTFSRLNLRQITKESSSEMVGAELLRADDGTYRLMGVYRNEPRLSFRDNSAIHYGAFVLQMQGNPVLRMEGHYWTDRHTDGQLLLHTRNDKYIDSWEEGLQMSKPETSR